MLSRKLWQAVRWATDREGGGCLLPDDQCTKTGRPFADVIQEKHPDMQVPPVENPTCAAFEKYEDVPETVPLDFTEDDVTWVASKLSGAAGALGAELGNPQGGGRVSPPGGHMHENRATSCRCPPGEAP